MQHDPIHARNLQRHSRHATVLQPCDHPLEARRRRGKALDLAVVAVSLKKTNPMLLTPHIDAGHIPAQSWKPIAFVQSGRVRVQRQALKGPRYIFFFP